MAEELLAVTIKNKKKSLNDESEKLSDLLFFIVKGIAVINTCLRNNGRNNLKADRFIPEALYITVANTNFNVSVIGDYINSAVRMKFNLIEEASKYGIDIPEYKEVLFSPEFPEYVDCAKQLPDDNGDPELFRIKNLVGCAVKGASSYVYHAGRLGFENDDIYELMQAALTEICRENMGADEIVKSISFAADCCLRAISFIDLANTSTFGDQEQTMVNLESGNNPGILVSGHDIKDLEDLLKQTKGHGIDIYTHSDLLPANCYSKL